MFESLLDKLFVFSDDIYRNIATVTPSEHLFDDLADSGDAWGAADLAVSQAKDADSFTSLIILRPFQYSKSVAGGIAPRMATRFSDGREYGVLYGSIETETTIYETVYHWLKFLLESEASCSGRRVETQRRVFKIAADGLIVDLRGKETEFPELVSKNSYHFTHQVGAYLYAQGQRGLIVKSARCEGFNTAFFSEEILSNVRHQCYLGYVCEMEKKRIIVKDTSGQQLLSEPFSTFEISNN